MIFLPIACQLSWRSETAGGHACQTMLGLCDRDSYGDPEWEREVCTAIPVRLSRVCFNESLHHMDLLAVNAFPDQ